MRKRHFIEILTVGVLAALAAGCGLRAKSFNRRTLVIPTQEIPPGIRRIEILPLTVEGPEPALHTGVPTGAVASKIAQLIRETGYYEVSILSHVATDLPNYKDIIKALIERGVVDPDLIDAITTRDTPPDALLAGTIWIGRGAPWGSGAWDVIGGLAGRPKVPEATPQEIGPSTRVAISGTFCIGRIGASFQAHVEEHETQPYGRLQEVSDRFAEAVVENLVPRWEEQKWKAFYESDTTKAAALRLKAYGVPDKPRREDLMRVKEDLERYLKTDPEDAACALFLKGLVHELAAQGQAANPDPLLSEACSPDLEEAKHYYDRAIGARPEDGFSEALERVAKLGTWVRGRAKQLRAEQAAQKAAEEKAEQGKDYRDLLKKD